MICQLPCHPCLTGSPPTTPPPLPQARPLRPNYCSACVSVCLCKKQGSAGQKGKIIEEAPWKDGKKQPAHAPSANPVAWDGISNPVWCVTQHFTTGCRLCYLNLSRGSTTQRRRTKQARYEPKRKALALPSPPHFARTSSYPPVAGPPGGHRRRPALCCWFVKIGGFGRR